MTNTNREIARLWQEVRQLQRVEQPQMFEDAFGLFMLIPELRGFWPMSSFDVSNFNALDVSPAGRDLTRTAATYGKANSNGYAPTVFFDGSTARLAATDAAWSSITGDHTLGCWVYIDDTPGADEGIVGKWDSTGNNRTYLIYYQNSGTQFRYIVSDDGTGTTAAVNSTVALTAATWTHIVCRYTTSTEIAIFVNGTKTTNTTSIPASLHDSTADFAIGSFNGSANWLDGRASLAFLSAHALPDVAIQKMYTRTRGLFGV